MEKARPIDPGFSTADAEIPAIQFDGDGLVAKFRDWKESLVTVRFQNVYAFSWQGLGTLLEEEPFDGSCEIEHSAWLAANICGIAGNKEGLNLHHYKFNFNAGGSLGVICSKYVVEVI